MTLLVIVVSVVGIALLVVRYRGDQAKMRRQRAAFFDDCMDMLESPKLSVDAFGYPCLTGKFEGERIRTDVVVDCMGLRKLPSLWLRVTLEAPIATNSVLDVMMRPSGTEFFSPFSTLEDRLDTPPDWPERAVVHTDDPAGLPAPEIITPHMDILEEFKAKELIIAPKGVRIVWQADEAQRSDYLLLRQARFDVVRFDPERFGDLVTRLLNLRRALAKPAPEEPYHEAAA